MSKTFKRLTAVLLLLVTILSMTACAARRAEKELQKLLNTQAVKVGQYTLGAVELNYFFVDAVVEWFNTNGSMSHLMGFDPGKPLNEQIISSATGETWADSFLDTALKNAQSTYAMYDQAMKAGFTLPRELQLDVDKLIVNLQSTIDYYKKLYESMGYEYPYSDVAGYLTSTYGTGADAESYKKYYEVCTVANAYYDHYAESLTFSSKELRAYEADKLYKYASYSYEVYYLSVAQFENAAEAEKVAKELAAGNYADKDAFDAAIKALAINKDVEEPALSNTMADQVYAKIPSYYAEWLSAEDRETGDMTVATNPDLNDKTKAQGYYVIRYLGKNTNEFILQNIRQVYVAFQGGTSNAITGEITFSKVEKEAARSKAEKMYVEFTTGAMSELVFGNMADQYSDATVPGGLYENLQPGQLDQVVEDWANDPIRIAGDVEMLLGKRGYHIVYFVSHSKLTYRDYLVTQDLKADTISAWYDALLEAMKPELLNDTYVNKALVLGQ